MTLNEWLDTGDRFSWRDQEVFYQEDGEGEVIFLLHGFLTSGWIFKDIWKDLVTNFRVIAPDYVGFGYSSKPKNYSYSFDERVEMIYDLAALLQIQQIHVLAHSFSVSTALELIKRDLENRSPIEINSITMLNGGLFKEQSIPSYSQRLLLSPLHRIISPLLGRKAYKNSLNRRTGKYHKIAEDYLNELFDQVLYNDGLSLLAILNRYLLERRERNEEWKLALLKTDIPVQLIWGIDREDQIGGIRAAHEYRKLKGDQYVVMMKDIGHFPQIERPERVIEYYLNFLNGVRRN